MKKNYILPLMLIMLLVSTKVFADYDYDEDEVGVTEGFYMALFGAGIYCVGYIVGKAKFLAGFARVISITGMVIGVIGLAGIALKLISWALQTALILAYVCGGLFVAGYILYAIYQWLFSPKK